VLKKKNANDGDIRCEVGGGSRVLAVRVFPNFCLRFARVLPNFGLRFARVLPNFGLRFARVLPNFGLRFARVLPNFGLRFALGFRAVRLSRIFDAAPNFGLRAQLSAAPIFPLRVSLRIYSSSALRRSRERGAGAARRVRGGGKSRALATHAPLVHAVTRFAAQAGSSRPTPWGSGYRLDPPGLVGRSGPGLCTFRVMPFASPPLGGAGYRQAPPSKRRRDKRPAAHSQNSCRRSLRGRGYPAAGTCLAAPGTRRAAPAPRSRLRRSAEEL
jgi:hypothetical protein